MPRLPDVTSFGRRPIPEAGGGVVSYGIDTSAQKVAELQVRTGQTISNIGRNIEESQHRTNNTRAEEAYNKLREKQLELTNGPDGFTNRRSGDAVNQPILEEYQGKFTSISQELEGSLANAEQRSLFRARANVSRIQLTEGILSHVSREKNVYDKQVYEGGINVEVQNATAHWNNPNSVGISLERITGLVSQEADRLGWAPDFAKSVQSEETSKIHETVIYQALGTNNFQYAWKWYKDHKDSIDAATGQKIQNAFDRYRSEYERKIEKQINSVTSTILSGFPPSQRQLAPLVQAARGTSMEPEAQRMVMIAKATENFSKIPPSQQTQTLAQLESRIRANPMKEDVTLLNALRSIHESQQRALKESPVVFAIRQGIVDPTHAGARSLDLSKPDNLGPALSARFDLARHMSNQYGAEFKPLTQDETSVLSNALRQANVQQKREYFGALQRSSGNDFAGYSAIMAQIAPDDPVTAMAGVYSARGRNQATDLMLRGISILKPSKKEDGSPDKGKLWPMPPDPDLRREFANYEGEAFSGHPQARSDMYQAALSIYAAKAAAEGDSSGELDTDRWEESIKLATGGIDSWNGRNTVMPYGYDRSQFKDELYRHIDILEAGGNLAPGVDGSDLKDMPLEPIGDGRYIFRSGDGALVGTDGTPIIVDFNTPLPVLTPISEYDPLEEYSGFFAP